MPASLDPVFQRMFEEHWPVVSDTIDGVHRWCQDHPGAKHIKRFVGSHSFSIEGASNERWLQSFTQWMAQHALDAYAALEDDARSRADVWLRRVGGYEAMQTPLLTRVRREHNRLVPA